jgi:hypothetical protein
VLKAAGEIDSTAVAQVRDVVAGTIASVKVVLKEPLRIGYPSGEATRGTGSKPVQSVEKAGGP